MNDIDQKSGAESVQDTDCTKNTKDAIYASPMSEVPKFVFDASVVSVFPDMIQRSVPGYSTVIAMSGILAERFAQPDTRLYDLGASLGASSFAMADKAHPSCEVIAVDNSASMVKQLQSTVCKQKTAAEIKAVHSDIQLLEVSNASVVAINYTLQFIPVEQRETLLAKIYRGMTRGGVLIVSEKLKFDDPAVNELYIDLHHEFKRSNGYSDLEISQKRQAIEDVLLAETLDTHRDRLARVGFQRIEVWFQCLNFASLIAFR